MAAALAIGLALHKLLVVNIELSAGKLTSCRGHGCTLAAILVVVAELPRSKASFITRYQKKSGLCNIRITVLIVIIHRTGSSVTM